MSNIRAVLDVLTKYSHENWTRWRKTGKGEEVGWERVLRFVISTKVTKGWEIHFRVVNNSPWFKFLSHLCLLHIIDHISHIFLLPLGFHSVNINFGLIVFSSSHYVQAHKTPYQGDYFLTSHNIQLLLSFLFLGRWKNSCGHVGGAGDFEQENSHWEKGLSSPAVPLLFHHWSLNPPDSYYQSIIIKEDV